MSLLPTSGIIDGCRTELYPRRLTITAELDYVITYRGITYNNYEVQLLSGAWPEPEVVGAAIEGPQPISAVWQKSIDPALRALAVYRD